MAIRLATQFDDPGRRDLLVATPTCCSCCCCLVSTVTSATLAAVHVHTTAAAAGVPRARRITLTVAAALAGPVAIALAITAGWSVAMAIRAADLSDAEYALAVLAAVAVMGAWGLGVARLLRRAGHRRPWPPALVLVGGTTAGFLLELFTFGLLIWGQLAVFVAPFLAAELLQRRLDSRPPEVVAAGGQRR